MITYLKSTEVGLEIMPELCDGAWINVVDPTPEEIRELERQGFQRDYLTYPLDLDERARTEKEDGQMFILLRIPIFQGESADSPYDTIPLGIILQGRWVLTICRSDSDLLQAMSGGRIRGLSTSKRNRFVLHLLLAMANRYLSYLREINRATDALEDRLRRSTQNAELFGLLNYQKSMVYFTTALRSNELVLERLQRTQMFRQFEDDEELLEDALIEVRQAIEMTNIASNILSSTMDAFASIISNNVNAVMKFLAAITIVVALPTLVASLFGMNVPIPLQDEPLAFVVVLAVCLTLAVVVTYLFVKRNWM